MLGRPEVRSYTTSTASPARLRWYSQVASASASDSLNCAVSGASSGRGEGRKIKDALFARETVEQVDDFAGRVKAKRVEFPPAPRCPLSRKGRTMAACGSRSPDWRPPPHPAAGVRSGWATVPRGASADRDSCVAGRDARSAAYGIENTTDKVRLPGAVRRRRDAVCTERIVAYSDNGHLFSRVSLF